MFSIIILAYNRCSEVLITLDKLQQIKEQFRYPLEIIVVDNASLDDTSAAINQNYPDVNLITKIKNNGIAGWNDGFKVARYKYFLVLDDDSHIESGLQEAVEYLEANSTTGILALNVTTGPFLTESMGWDDKQDVAGFIGCGAVIRKEVYDKIGGFAEWLHVYTHEYEYGIRCLDAGYKIRYFRNSSVIHRASTANRSFKRIRIYSTRNEMGIIYKYFGQDRWKILFKMWANNIKRTKDVGLKYAYYEFLGSIKFLQFKKTLVYTPVSKETQIFFASHFLNPHPVFGFVTKSINNLLGINNKITH
jgi:GT2 family glycosyltransferase